MGSDFKLLLEEDKATIAIIVQDCSQYWLDGEDLSPTQHAHVWVEVEGRQEIRPIVGARQTLPTRKWFGLFAGSTNVRGREARKVSGTSPEAIEGVSLNPPGSSLGGRVNMGSNRSYSWHVSSELQSAIPTGVNHDVYVRDDAGKLVLKRISALANLVAVPSQGTLEVKGGVETKGLVPSGSYPALVYTIWPIWARVTLGAEPPERSAGPGTSSHSSSDTAK